MAEPAAWIVLIMVIRWISWSVLWWRGELLRPAAWNDGRDGVMLLPPRAAAHVAIEPGGALVLRIDLAGVPGWPGGIQLSGNQ
jgi:hypothetical protein